MLSMHGRVSLGMAGGGPVRPPPAMPWPQAGLPFPGPTVLPDATTFTRLAGLPADPHPFAVTGGQVVHPLTQEPVYAVPGGLPVALLPVAELGEPTWVPVIQARPGWARVLLPSRPNHVTGWLSLSGADASQFVVRRTAYLIRVDLARDKLTVTENGHSLGSWTVAVGATRTPTPAGRTFLLASIDPLRPTFSPAILPLGTHSNTLDSYAGGPGTVGLHGWPDPSVFGHPVSHGCVRVPAQALRVLSRAPLGTLVLIMG